MHPVCILYLFLTSSVLILDYDQKHEACSWNGVPLYGRVQIVENFADLKVQEVDSFPDLKVQHVTSFPLKCGEWQLVDSFPDFKIQIVDSFPDLKVQYVDSFPGLP